MQENALFVSATDTDVGKTVVSALLALKMRHLGLDCAVLKPFASGCERENGVLIPSDALWLQKTLDLSDSLDEICPIRLEEPLAPLVAAQRAGISMRHWPEIARDAFENLRAKHEFVIVEGVGGLLAPIFSKETGFASNLDLIKDWDLPAVLVARRTLGTINHTLLTLRAHETFAGLIFNDATLVSTQDIAVKTSPTFLAGVVSVPIWGNVPFASDLNFETLQGIAERLEISF